MPQPRTCTYCERPAVASAVVRTGPPRRDPYADPEAPKTKDLSQCQVVRYCDVEHRRAGAPGAPPEFHDQDEERR